MINVCNTCLTGAINTVRINNDLGARVNLTIHPQSGDDDLGWHTLRYKQDFHFSFHEKFGRTLFFCRFVWSNQCHYYDVFSKHSHCYFCDYFVRPDGLWIRNFEKKTNGNALVEKKLPWKSDWLS
ncbi:S-protein homolog 2-like [Tripterygium wilfordii]|uniref:S-protein homolog 2-like n=1 Tax=Tripterygium wilfordii TaxID=458696 RepID=UPI0018F81CFA|nr:S-protein homolog 2-like [Tripterygium wilfordii]